MMRDREEGERAEVKPDETRETKGTDAEKREMWKESEDRYGEQERGRKMSWKDRERKRG